ncbi:MAG: dihydropteroate synthase [Cyclobacteriaceae bacterium]|nr:dihydropteroate synthase [Cyclobacteriaceae bacterium]
MGILNITPDSFYAGSRFTHESEILARATRMAEEGVDLFDIGGYSTRPGAATVEESEELRRVLPAVELLAKHFPDKPVSIDTFRASVARQAVEAGALLVNDVSGGELDARMMETVAELGVPYILMHMRGTPETMSSLATYTDLIKEMTDYFHQKVHQLRQLGVRDIVLDPGFGFAKVGDQNFELLRSLGAFQTFRLPLLVGLSRKSMIWRTLSIEPEEALNGTTALHMVALQHGAKILRVHDVRPARECIQLFTRLYPKPA